MILWRPVLDGNFFKGIQKPHQFDLRQKTPPPFWDYIDTSKLSLIRAVQIGYIALILREEYIYFEFN